MGLLDGIFGGGSSSKSSSSASSPWKPAAKAYKTVLNDAGKVYKSGIGSQPFTGSTVIPYSNQTEQGMRDTMAAAGRAQPGLNQAFTHMSDVSKGKFLNSNPYLDQEIAQNADDIERAQNMAASAAGRYGSGGYQGVTQMAIGRMANAARMENYARERAAQDAAANGLGANYQATLAPGATKMDVGGMYEDLATRQKNDEIRLFNERQNQPWAQMGKYLGIAQGAGGSGQGTTTTTAQGPSRISGALGGAISGYGAFGGSPYGALAGGIAGYYQ